MLRAALLRLSRNKQVKDALVRTPVTRDVVARFIPGETLDELVPVAHGLKDKGLTLTIDHLGEDTVEVADATRTRDAYLALLDRLAAEGLTDVAEVSVKLSAVGQAPGKDGEKLALDHAPSICMAARNAGTTVTLDMEDHTTTDSTLGILRELRADFPSTGAVIQAYLRRSEADCADLAGAGSRVRLCKGAYSEPESVAYTDKDEVDLAYVRCLKVLMKGDGYPMVASHDPRMISIAQDMAARLGRTLDSFELQMLYGIRPHEQERLALLGHTVRVYTPYGHDWYGYFVRRLAERPANVGFFLRSFTTKH